MASITSGIGLATGIDIQGVVDQLIAISAISRDNLIARTEKLQNEQLGITELSAYLYAFQSLVVNLSKESLYEGKTTASSNEAAMTATVTSNDLATLGSYTFTTLQTAKSEQWLSTGVMDKGESLSGSEFSFRFGDDLERAQPLEILNGGNGIELGVIRITDRSGAWSDIDLTQVQTLDDVVDAISSELSINVTAELHGDGIRLIDDTGQSATNLLVQEVSGSTAASLGLDGINVAASSAQGSDLVSLYDELNLSQLNDGNGVGLAWEELPGDIDYILADGTTGTIDFTPPDGETGFEDTPTTIGALIQRFNEAEPGKLEIELSGDGQRLIVTDLTTGGETFALSANTETESHALEDLGLTGEQVGGVITGRRLLGGTGSVLVSTLNGGSTEALGSIDITDRSGASMTIDLSGAATIEEVLETINASGLAVTAELNDAKNGIRLTDTSGVTTSNFIVASSGVPDTAALLGITVDTEETIIESGDLHQQFISYDTRLADLNGGAGIPRGSFTVIDKAGKQTVFNLADPQIQTIDDLMQIASQGEADISIDINPDGDGIVIKDLSTGNYTFKVIDGSRGTAAALQLTGGLEEMDIGGEMVWAINGSMTHTIELETGDTLESLVEKINEISSGANASILNDGSTKPYRMILGSAASGLQSSMVLDWSQLGIHFANTVEGTNAAISLGEADSGILLTSTTNSFTEVVDGVTLHAHQVSSTPTTITIGRSNVDLVATVSVMVQNYNKFRERYNDLTSFNQETGKAGVLFTDITTRSVGNELGWALSDRYVGLGSIQTIRELGLTINSSNGTLSFDKNTLKAKFAEDPEAIREFFTSDPTDENAGINGMITVDDLDEPPTVGSKGFAVVLNEMLESLIGPNTSLVARRYIALDNKITSNEEHVEFMNERLEAERTRLLMKFYYMELAISKIQNNMTVIDSIAPLDLSSSSGNS